uniref:Beta-carotene oxygenase 2b n=1 Tax=Cyprinus carpio TaxID=7962 RepID=A0A8C2JCV8_CYPCA
MLNSTYHLFIGVLLNVLTNIYKLKYTSVSFLLKLLCHAFKSCHLSLPTGQSDNANVSFVQYKGDYYVSTETDFMHKIDPQTQKKRYILIMIFFKCIKYVGWTKFVAVNGATAHPHVDPDGTTYNMGNSYTRKGASVVCSIPSEDKSKPSYYPAYHVINKHTGNETTANNSTLPEPHKYYTKPLSAFHQINCYEENSFLIMDMCCSDDGQANNNYLIQNLKKSANALDEVYNTMYRVFPHHFVWPLNVDSHTPCGQNLNTHLNTTATAIKTDKNKVWNSHTSTIQCAIPAPTVTSLYGCGFRHQVGDSLIKMDLQGKQIKVSMYPSEPFFVSSPGAVEEDDGVILSVVITPNLDKSTFLLVDAKRFEGLGRAEVPISIPYGFHGTFQNRH